MLETVAKIVGVVAAVLSTIVFPVFAILYRQEKAIHRLEHDALSKEQAEQKAMVVEIKAMLQKDIDHHQAQELRINNTERDISATQKTILSLDSAIRELNELLRVIQLENARRSH